MPRISTDNYDTVASWNGSQDLFVVEQPDGTKVATPAMVKQYVLGNSIDDIYSVMGQNGAKNLIPYPYPKMSTTVRGITWSDNGDGGIVGNGTGTEASSQPYCDLNGSLTNNAKDLLLKANTWYTLTCKRTSPYAIGANIYFLDPTTMQQTSITFDVIYGDSAQTTATKNNVFMYNAGVVSEEVKFKLAQDMYAQVQVRYKAGTNVTVSNDVQYPMLRLAADTDNTYEPYAKTNKQLTDELDTAREQISELKTSGLVPVPFTVTPSNNITNLHINDQNCYYIPATGEVHIQFLFYTPDANIPVIGNIIATVPSAYKPSKTVQFVSILGNDPLYNANIERGFVNSANGGIALNNFVYGNRATSWIYVDVSYIK